MNVLAEMLVFVGGSYAFFAVFAALNADRIIFQPRESSYRDGTRIIKLRAEDGVSISALHLPAKQAKRAILFLHGNSEDIGDLLPRLEELQARGYTVLAVDYRGYGTSEGQPNEAGVILDAMAALKHLTGPLGWPDSKVILYGRSMGSGPAVELAARENLAGLVIEGGLGSAFRVVTGLPILPGDRFPNLSRISRVRCPMLFVHGVRDRTIPVSHGRRLFHAARGPKSCLWVEEARHNDVVAVAGERYWTALGAFVGEPGA